MESSGANPKYDASWSSNTNWTVAGGSIENSVSFQSSLSLINDESSTDNSTAKSPLILYSPSPDSSTSCQITITFAQKHEVRQFYVRSTARVYEIYYAPELQDSNEYLCTVRCGIAVRDGEVLHATDIEKTVLAHQNSATNEISEERLRHGSDLYTSDDDWVQVKVRGAQLVNGNSSPSSDSDTSQGKSSQLQDLYEATADITDANPSMSITLRLLSLQNKGCICIDEVYVFADPVDAADLDNKVAPLENYAGSSVMAMLMPAFLQLSKTKGVSQAQDICDADRTNGQKSEEIEAKPPDQIDAGNEIRQEGKSDLIYQQGAQLQEAVTMPITKPVQQEIPPHFSGTESKPDLSQHPIEGVLNQLVSRVSRMEDLFVRFEDCMLKPIRSIDERLQRVEQQLELLTKTQNSRLLSCRRISAPEFSCSESETNSLYKSGCVGPSFAACDTNKKDAFPAVSCILSDATPVSVHTSNSHPSLVVTAPEFSNSEDEEEDDEVEPVKESQKEKQKPAMSIDDALASALAGFLTSTSVQSPKYSKTLAVKAPEFPNEGNNNDATGSPKGCCETIVEPPTDFIEADGTEITGSSFSPLSNISSLESDESVRRLSNNNGSVQTGVRVDEHLQPSQGNDGDSHDNSIDLTVCLTHEVGRTSFDQIPDNVENGQIGNETSNTSATENTVSLERFFGNQTDDGLDATKEGVILNESITHTEVTDKGSNLDILQIVVEFPHPAAKVDFETPILEVKFTSLQDLNAKSPLEALLGGVPDMNVEVQSLKKSGKDDSQIDDQRNLIPLDELTETGSATNNRISIDLDYCNLHHISFDGMPF